ncbi:exonuclease SbcCD subunit D C-terminal domain-containing protein [Arcanobacterium hippocoleae]
MPHTFYRKLKTLRGSAAQMLKSPEFSIYSDDFVRIEVTDRERPRDLVAVLRRRFPHLVQVSHVGFSAAAADYNFEMLRQQPRAVIEMFFAESGGRVLNSGERDLIREIWEEITAESEVK